jgi:hypothetical protein
VVAHAVELGCTPMTSEEAYRHITSLLGARRPDPQPGG